MKFLTLAVLTTTLLSTSVKAGEISANIQEYGFSTTLAPSFATIGCSGNSQFGGSTQLCISGVALNLGLTSLTALVLLKEEMIHVKADAYNFLAGEEISLALEEQMEKVREAAPELATATDEEVVAVMIQITNLK